MHIKVFLWAFATILVSLLLYQTFVSMKAFALKPTFATSVFLDQKDANVPDTTFCTLSKSFVSSNLVSSNARTSMEISGTVQGIIGIMRGMTQLQRKVIPITAVEYVQLLNKV